MLRIDEREYFIDAQKVSRPSGRGIVFIYRVKLRIFPEISALASQIDASSDPRRRIALELEFLRLTTSIRKPHKRDLSFFPAAFRFNFPQLEEDEENSESLTEKQRKEARENILKNLYRTVEPILNKGVTLEYILDNMNIFQVIIRSNGLDREKWMDYAEQLRIANHRNEPDSLMQTYHQNLGSKSKTFASTDEALEHAKKRLEKQNKREGTRGKS